DRIGSQRKRQPVARGEYWVERLGLNVEHSERIGWSTLRQNEKPTTPFIAPQEVAPSIWIILEQQPENAMGISGPLAPGPRNQQRRDRGERLPPRRAQASAGEIEVRSHGVSRRVGVARRRASERSPKRHFARLSGMSLRSSRRATLSSI